jgi:hypothetical protein
MVVAGVMVRYTIHDSPAYMGTSWLNAAGQRIDHRQHR